VAPRGEDLKIRLHAFHVIFDGVAVFAAVGAQPQILADRHVGEDPPAFRYHDDAQADDPIGGCTGDIARVPTDRSGLGPQQSRDRAQQSRLAGAVWTEDRDDLIALDGERTSWLTVTEP
jgi:hypothetical protein